mmetsp:Transcript_41606/g.120481  ORF Transcript_41606/g.120481 Transcript_41606/m.120481 type:complete len:215 (+) Transcript_41606:302-946(+)
MKGTSSSKPIARRTGSTSRFASSKRASPHAPAPASILETATASCPAPRTCASSACSRVQPAAERPRSSSPGAALTTRSAMSAVPGKPLVRPFSRSRSLGASATVKRRFSDRMWCSAPPAAAAGSMACVPDLLSTGSSMTPANSSGLFSSPPLLQTMWPASVLFPQPPSPSTARASLSTACCLPGCGSSCTAAFVSAAAAMAHTWRGSIRLAAPA